MRLRDLTLAPDLGFAAFYLQVTGVAVGLAVAAAHRRVLERAERGAGLKVPAGLILNGLIFFFNDRFNRFNLVCRLHNL